jgi:hypothetical protein
MNDIQAADTIAAAFIARWELSGGKELANYQSFLIELCSLLGVAPPDPTTTDDRQNAYVFERAVPNFHSDDVSGTGRIDLYKRGCFVLETKQGVDRHVSADPYLKTPTLTRVDDDFTSACVDVVGALFEAKSDCISLPTRL